MLSPHPVPLRFVLAAPDRIDARLGRSPWPARIKLLVRLLVIALVVWGVWRAVDGALANLEEREFSLAELTRLHIGWLLAAALVYLVGMAPACWFWGKVLRALGQRPGRLSLVRAFYIGHLGKYVPGKAMVVVLRAGLLRGSGVDATTAAVSVFVETLTMMAVGAAVGAALLALFYREHAGLVLLGAAMMLGAGVPTLPPIFRRLVKTLQVHRINPEIERALHGLDRRLMLRGWASMAAAWCLLGLSLAAVLESLPDVAVQPGRLPLILATVALAMVAGFLSLIPGGLGVRELVIIPLLAPVPEFGEVRAIVAAVLLRLIWLLSELAAAAILYVVRPRAVATAPGRRDASASTRT
ncbi:MAG: flippase-like domain-containing protein [Planctomycetes bacterium]|nr:flippase-like domain-containing protein [Planctomycetota bacterium]